MNAQLKMRISAPFFIEKGGKESIKECNKNKTKQQLSVC